MKRRYNLLGLLILLSTVLSVVVVAAQVVYYPELRVSSKGNKWWFSTRDPVFKGLMFSGLDVDPQSVVAVYWQDSVEYDMTDTITHIRLMDKKVIIYFDTEDPDFPGWADGTRVTGELTTLDTFLATGPGFGWKLRP